jgi:hypothetical protein
MTVTGFILWFKTEWLMYFPMWTWDVAQAIHFYEAVLATLTIIVWHFYSVIFNPDTYPMSWAWITGNLTEHEMKEEHGLELEKIKAREKGELREFGEATSVRGVRVYATRREKMEKEKRRPFSLGSLYGHIQRFNETIKNWKGT